MEMDEGIDEAPVRALTRDLLRFRYAPLFGRKDRLVAPGRRQLRWRFIQPGRDVLGPEITRIPERVGPSLKEHCGLERPVRRLVDDKAHFLVCAQFFRGAVASANPMTEELVPARTEVRVMANAKLAVRSSDFARWRREYGVFNPGR